VAAFGVHTDRIQIPRASDAALVARALDGAARRLAKPDCANVLSEFHDRSGRSLQQALEILEVTPAEFLGRLVFYDGLGVGRCTNRRVLALTAAVGSPIVYVCPTFAPREAREPELAETVIIHEMLHSLGLGENPPTSLQITSRVRTLCGR
jgi:hypothetical protein